MLTIQGRKLRFCDGVSRRGFLKIGGFAFGGLSLGLPDLLRAEAASGHTAAPHKAVINIFLAGGPPHQDMWDVKTEAPGGIRGEFKPIKTNVPGIEICEEFPRIAKIMDKCAVIRSVVGSDGSHDGYQTLTGWSRRLAVKVGGYLAVGCVNSKLFGALDPAVPPAVALAQPARASTWAEPGSPGYLGPAYAAFRPFTVSNQGINRGAEGGISELRLKRISLDRLHDRQRLLRSVDRLRRDLESEESVQAQDAAFHAAFDMLASSKVADALDVSKEPAKIRERYGDGKPYKYQYDGEPTCNDHLLMARRLVEIGARSVTLSFGRWDSHGANFDLIRNHGRKLDQCFSALVEDLDQRGLLETTTVIAWGEFGRTPKINKNAGRDHWPRVSCAIMAGGGIEAGQVIGATNVRGEAPSERPVHIQEVVSTIYHNLGIDVENVKLLDKSGRPQYLLKQEYRRPMPELVR